MTFVGQIGANLRRVLLSVKDRGGRVSWRSRTTKIVLGVLLVLVGFRAALPYIVKVYVNDTLAEMEGYRGHVEDIDIALWRGAYGIDGLVITQIDGPEEIPFVEIPHTELSVEWRALFEGAVVAEIEMEHPVLNFVGGSATQDGSENDWRQTIDDLVPITINRLTIHEGEVHYRETGSPPIDVALTGLEAVAENLSTVRGEDEGLPADLHATAVAQGSGALLVDVRLDPWAERPTFDLDLSLEHLEASSLNSLMEAYVGVDAEAGEFFLYSEISSVNGSFEGYVKPMAEGLSLFRFGEDGDFFDQLGDAIVQVFEDLFENHGTDRFAVRVPVSGTMENIETDGFAAILSMLSNTIIEAISHGVEHEVGHRISRTHVASGG